jgi:hypothetical protein
MIETTGTTEDRKTTEEATTGTTETYTPTPTTEEPTKPPTNPPTNPPDSVLFRLVDEEGNDVSAGESGLLLYKGGTVCDDGFNMDSANIICREMGYSEASDWTYGNMFTRQEVYDIKLDDVYCGNASEWKYCSSSLYHNCGHSEDVFLTCTQEG